MLPCHYGNGQVLTEYEQSFINTKICYRSLSPQSFNNLNKRLFPVYFRCQLGLALLTIVTKPVRTWLVNDAGNVFLGLATVMAGLNWYVYGPRTSEAMIEKARVVKGMFLTQSPS